MGPNVLVRDTQTGHEYFVTEEQFKSPPAKGLWVRLDQGKPKTSVAKAAAKKSTARKRTTKKAAAPAATKKAASGQSADSNQEES